MSFDALAWAAKCNPGSPAKKLVLLALAECAQRETCNAFPSIAAVAEFTCLNRKTIIAAMDELERDGFIVDTGERAGKTKQIKIYHLSIETVPKTELSQKRNSSTFSVKESQKRDTEPVREPVIKTKRARAIPESWKPEPFGSGKCQAIISTWPDGEMETQIEHFTAHHVAKGTTSLDWQASWKTWVLNSRKWSRPAAPTNQATLPANDYLAHMIAKKARDGP